MLLGDIGEPFRKQQQVRVFRPEAEPAQQIVHQDLGSRTGSLRGERFCRVGVRRRLFRRSGIRLGLWREQMLELRSDLLVVGRGGQPGEDTDTVDGPFDVLLVPRQPPDDRAAGVLQDVAAEIGALVALMIALVFPYVLVLAYGGQLGQPFPVRVGEAQRDVSRHGEYAPCDVRLHHPQGAVQRVLRQFAPGGWLLHGDLPGPLEDGVDGQSGGVDEGCTVGWVQQGPADRGREHKVVVGDNAGEGHFADPLLLAWSRGNRKIGFQCVFTWKVPAVPADDPMDRHSGGDQENP